MVCAVLLAASATALATEPDETVEAPPAPSTLPPVPTKQRPLWELGLGVSGLRLPDYRGSDEHHNYALPFPYFVYRGTWLKSDRDGTRAMLFDSPGVKLDISLGATSPTHSTDNAAREGMPNLPGALEMGPSLNFTLARTPVKKWKLDLRLPVRAAVSLERSPRYVGTTFSPNLNLDLTDIGGWNVGVLTGPLFADRKYHELFYNVDPAYATAQRPTYNAAGGYAGWQVLASTSRRVGITWIGGFARYENLRGAVYEDSPLVRRRSALMLGFALSWVFTSSDQMVESAD